MRTVTVLDANHLRALFKFVYNHITQLFLYSDLNFVNNFKTTELIS